jgi:hypothetical protein
VASSEGFTSVDGLLTKETLDKCILIAVNTTTLYLDGTQIQSVGNYTFDGVTVVVKLYFNKKNFESGIFRPLVELES